MSKFPNFDGWTERDLLCAILVQLRRGLPKKAAKTGNVIKTRDFKVGKDFTAKLIDAAVKADPDNAAVAIAELAEANGVTVKTYPNQGMLRMNVGNMLRAVARKRHGLYGHNGKWNNNPDAEESDSG